MAFLQTNDIFKNELSSNRHQMTEEEVHQVQKISLEITRDVVQVCRKCGIEYMLTGGTALGAVRHGGFIPWDDDIDMVVARCDIDRLLDAIEAEYGDRYYIEAPLRTPGYLSSFIQIHRNGTIFQEYLCQDEKHCGIKIDIFVIENTYDNKLLRVMHGWNCELDLLLLSCYRMYAWRQEFLTLAKENKKALTVIRIKCALGCLLSPFAVFLYRRTQLCLRRCRNDHSEYIAVPSGRKHFFGELCRRDSYMESSPMMFEGESFSFPKNYDSYLKNMYGNYMEIPPVEKREHHVIYQLKF